MTAEEFERGFAERSGITVEQLRLGSIKRGDDRHGDAKEKEVLRKIGVIFETEPALIGNSRLALGAPQAADSKQQKKLTKKLT